MSSDRRALTPLGSATDQAMRFVEAELRAVAATLPGEGLPMPLLEGKLLRPLVAWAFVPEHARPRIDHRFWFGALAIEMVHEASLLHDDIIDEASVRRGKSTLNASRGVGAALVQGDHYLTAAYAVALKTESIGFVKRFIHAVERTVAGEIRQGQMAGTRCVAADRLDILAGKSGELFGLATSLGAIVGGDDAVDERVEIGRRIGTLYQQVDDLLDYCTDTTTGKPPLQDYRQKKWTWLLDETQILNLDVPEAQVLEEIFGRPEGGTSVADRALESMARTSDDLVGQSRPGEADSALLDAILQQWLSTATRAVQAQERSNVSASSSSYAPSAEAVVFETAWRAGQPEHWRAYFARHARTFSLAARLFPKSRARQIEGLYAWCRITDDLVDDPIVPGTPDVLEVRLDIWRRLSRAAYDGHRTGIPVLQAVMGKAAESSVDWRYPQALLHAVGLDISHQPFDDWPALERYTFGVAGAVGGWMTQLFGVHDAETLDRAHAMGHALQLTNIIRDVGEDLARHRIYLPVVLMKAHGFDGADLHEWRASGERPAGYRAAIEEVMAVADAYHAFARPGLARLPAAVRLPVAAAAEAYRGIEHEVRRNDYDNLTRRAHTSVGRKVILGARGIAAAIRPQTTTAASGGRLVGNILPHE